ncbi:response regulator [Candidatus Bathyarchaeota archaeon]|nr:response regulator [Candidatus Bathyarchaeota archaeon]
MDKPARILVVDDDKDIRITIEAILKNEGYTVDLAANGSDAIKKSENAAYNVVLIDIHLPDMAGIELLTRIRNSVPKVRKIILTGYPSTQNAIAAVNRNADAYLVKPVDLGELLELVREQLRKQEAEKEYSQEKVADFIETRFREKSET